MMGAAKVGKSAIINQFLYSTFTPKYKRTVEEMHHGDFNVSGIQLTLDILDTSGSYEFPAMRDLSIKSADAFVLVYDVNDSNTFLEVKTLRAQILSTKGAVPIVVVGNKIDLVETEQEVSLDDNKIIVEFNFFWEFSEDFSFSVFQKRLSNLAFRQFEKIIFLEITKSFIILKKKRNLSYYIILEIYIPQYPEFN